MLDMIGIIIDLERRITTNEWISVKDRLPQPCINVIVAICDDVGDTPWRYTTVGWMANDSIWIIDNDIGYGVTHWMPLPTYPAENNK